MPPSPELSGPISDDVLRALASTTAVRPTPDPLDGPRTLLALGSARLEHLDDCARPGGGWFEISDIGAAEVRCDLADLASALLTLREKARHALDHCGCLRAGFDDELRACLPLPAGESR